MLILFGVIGLNFYGGMFFRFRVRCVFDEHQLSSRPYSFYKESHTGYTPLCWDQLEYPSWDQLLSTTGPDYAPELGGRHMKPGLKKMADSIKSALSIAPRAQNTTIVV